MAAVEQRVVAAGDGDLRVDRWFKKHFPGLAHGRLEKLLRTGQVRVDGKRVKASDRVAEGQIVRVPPLGDLSPVPRSASPKRPVDTRVAEDLRRRVLYRDDHVLAIDKPAGLAVQGGEKTTKHLDAALDALTFDARERPRLVHRLDKDTSGVLVLARSQAAARDLSLAFRGRDVRKIYWTIVVGVPEIAQGRIDLPLAKGGSAGAERMGADEEAGKPAITYYATLDRAGRRAAWLAMWPRTGRTHQLRAHAQAIGTPILGDGKYGGPDAFLPGADLPRQLHLHARRLVLPHPADKGLIDVTAPLPPHMKKSFDYFGFNPGDQSDDPFDFD